MSGKDKRQNAGRMVCPFPNCGKVYTPVDGQPPFCAEHKKLVGDINFIQQNIINTPLIPTARPAQGARLIVPRPGEILSLRR